MKRLLRILGVLLVGALLFGLLRYGRSGHTTYPLLLKPRRVRTSLLSPLSTFRVFEKEGTQGIAYRADGYRAQLGACGLEFETPDGAIRSGLARVEQGGREIGLKEGRVSRGDFARGEIDRGPVTEEYRLENRRVEQLFRVTRPLGDGPMTFRVRMEGVAKAIPTDGGLILQDREGRRRVRYSGAVAIDAEDRRVSLNPAFENGEIVLEVPAAFMATAAFPVLVDPWIEDASSASHGGVSNSVASGQVPSLAVDASGHPVIAWADTENLNSQIYVRRYDGTAWVELAGSGSGNGVSNSSGSANNPSLVLDAQGNPVVAWADQGNLGTNLYLKRFDGNNWVEVAGSATGKGISNLVTMVALNPCLALGPSGNPVVCWLGMGGGNGIYVRGFDGTNWSGFAGSDQGGGLGMGFAPCLKVDGNGRPIVAWTGMNNGTDAVYLLNFNGTSWVQLAGSATGAGLSHAGGTAQEPSLALDGSGHPAVAWSDNRSGFYEIHFTRYDGQAWAGLAGSDAGAGISNSGTGAFNPSLVLDASAHPVVAWSDNASGAYEIKLRRYDGSAWVEMEGSDTGKGISNDLGDATVPSLALDSSGNPRVAWQDASSGKAQVYVRAYQAPASSDSGSGGGGSGGACGLVGLDAIAALLLLHLMRRRTP